MKQTTKIRRTRTLMRRAPLAAMAAAIIGFVLPVMAAPPLPREPMPKPTLPGTFQGVPKPPIRIGTRPKFNPSNIGALPDLKIVRVTPRIHSRVAGVCRSGRKATPGGSIPVLNFDLVVKNVGRGTAYMDRYGVILSARTMDFHERVFDTNKRYQGGTGGPGHFQGPHGTQPWMLVRMGQIAPGATFTAHSGLGVGSNNTRFTIARMHELAGQTHRFRIKLTSYGSPGLKESNTRNNEYIVSYTFPRNFCQTVGGIHVRPVGVPVSTLPTLPDLKIVRVTPRLHIQARDACRTGRSPHGGLVGFDVQVKNIGAGMADLSRYIFAVHATSADGQTPAMRGGDGYARARRTPARVAPGQTFSITGGSGVVGGYYGHPVTFPVSRYSELAGKTRRFKVEIISGTGIGHGLPESNYRNNAKTVSFTFPNNFCKATARSVQLTQTVGTLKPHLVIQSIRTQLRRPYECRTDGPTFADGDLVIKNTGGDFIPNSRLDAFYISGHLSVGSNRLSLYSADRLRSRIPAGAIRHVRFTMTGTAGLLHTPTPSMSVLAGRTVSISVRSDFGVTGNRNSSIHFPSDFCAARTTGGISAPIGSGQTIKPNIIGFQFAGGKNCVSPGGTFTIKGSAFGNSAAGRTIALGGNGVGFNLPIKSWNNRTIRVQLPPTRRLQYHKNYWVGIQATAVAGSVRTLSNLKRGVVLCPPTVHVGTSGSSGNQSAHQNGSNATPTGLPDLEISAMNFDKAECFQPSTGPGERGRFNIPLLRGTVTVKNKGFATYTHRKNVPFAIFLSGARNILMPLRSGSHGSRYALVATMGSGNGPGVWNDIKIDSGESREFPLYLHLYHSLTAHRIARGDDKTSFDRQDARSVLGKSASVEINIGPRKHYRLNKTAALESHYENNSRRVLISFPSLACGSRL